MPHRMAAPLAECHELPERQSGITPYDGPHLPPNSHPAPRSHLEMVLDAVIAKGVDPNEPVVEERRASHWGWSYFDNRATRSSQRVRR